LGGINLEDPKYLRTNVFLELQDHGIHRQIGVTGDITLIATLAGYQGSIEEVKRLIIHLIMAAYF
jgi:hypothetical protein